MSLKINRIIEDLGDPSSEIQVLALTMVPRLSPDMNLTPKDVAQLTERINKLMLVENQDVVFLARKAANFLGQLASGGAGPKLPPREDPVHQSATSLASALASEKDATKLATILSGLRRLQDRTVLAAVKPHLTHADARVRANAVEVFEEAGSDADIPLLVPLVEDENNRVRSNAIKALGKFGYPKVKEALQQMLATDRVAMRESAVYAISQLGGLDALDILERLVDDGYEGVRRRVVECLKANQKPASSALLERMLGDASAPIRDAAAAALSARGVDVAALLQKTRRAAEPQAAQVVEHVAREVAASSHAPAAAPDHVASAQPAGLPAAAPAPRESPAASSVAAASSDAAAAPGSAQQVSGGEPGADDDDALLERHAQVIADELAGAERKAVLARALFALGRQSLRMCQTGRLKDTAALKEYYDTMSVLRNLAACEAKVRAGAAQGLDGELAQTGVEHYQVKLKVALIRVGKVYLDLCRRGAITTPDSPLIRKLLDLV